MNEPALKLSLPLRWLFAALGGVLYFLGFAGFGWWPLALVALVPLWLALEASVHDRLRLSLGLGFVYGFVTYGGGYHWMLGFFERFSGYGLLMNLFFASVFFAYIGLQFACIGVCFAWMRRRGWPLYLIAIAGVIAFEWGFPMLFPTFIANSFHDLPWVIQIADLGGPSLVSFVVLLINYAVFSWLRRDPNYLAHARRWSAIAILATIATLAYGTYRISEVEARIAEAPKLQVGLVQVNMGIFEKRSEVIEGLGRHIEQTQQLTREAALDLVIWPESAYTGLVTQTLLPTLIPASIEVPVLFGGIRAGKEARQYYNTAFLRDAEGKLLGSYDKTYLLAFGEYIPLGDIFPILYEWSPNTGRFLPGMELVALELEDLRIAPLICYEDVLPGFARAMVRTTQPKLLVNITNDAWFGDSQEPWIHLAMAKFRAVEHHRALVRSTNSGVSAFIDPLGRVQSNTGLMTREQLSEEVALLEEDTLYTMLGDWPAWLAALICLFCAVFRRRSL